jgi:hypothetical protein
MYPNWDFLFENIPYGNPGANFALKYCPRSVTLMEIVETRRSMLKRGDFSADPAMHIG